MNKETPSLREMQKELLELNKKIYFLKKKRRKMEIVINRKDNFRVDVIILSALHNDLIWAELGEVKDALSIVPKEHVRAVGTFYLGTPHSITKILKGVRRIPPPLKYCGICLDDEIYFKSGDRPQLMDTTLHEVGHVIYKKVLTPQQRKRIDSLFENPKPDYFLREYSEKYRQEFFADSYHLYFLKKANRVGTALSLHKDIEKLFDGFFQ